MVEFPTDVAVLLIVVCCVGACDTAAVACGEGAAGATHTNLPSHTPRRLPMTPRQTPPRAHRRFPLASFWSSANLSFICLSAKRRCHSYLARCSRASAGVLSACQSARLLSDILSSSSCVISSRTLLNPATNSGDDCSVIETPNAKVSGAGTASDGLPGYVSLE